MKRTLTAAILFCLAGCAPACCPDAIHACQQACQQSGGAGIVQCNQDGTATCRCANYKG